MTLLAGSARIDITPAGSVPMSGYGARTEPSSGTHDPLYATALLLDDGARTVAVVSADLLNVSRRLTAGVERRLAHAAVPVDDLLLAATHTHGGPYVPTPAIDVHPTLSVDEDVSSVLDGIEEGIAEAITTAHGRLEPATARVGTATTDTVVNRRAKLGARLPAETVDREVIALAVTGDSGAETLLYSLACHPVSITGSETRFTADWPGVVRRLVPEEREGEPTVLFLNGAAGDVTTRAITNGSNPDEDPYAYMETVGGELAESVLAALVDAENGSPIDHGPLLTERRALRLPVKRTPPIDVLDRRRRDLEAQRARLVEDGHDRAAARYRRDLAYLDELRSIADWGVGHLPARLQYVELGPIGLLGFPGEAFAQHGLDLKAAATAETLVPVGYATDYVGYLPTLAELENWGYEVRTTKVSPEAVVRFREAALELVS